MWWGCPCLTGGCDVTGKYTRRSSTREPWQLWGNKPVGLTATIITCPQPLQSPAEVLYSAHSHTHTGVLFTQKKNSNPHEHHEPSFDPSQCSERVKGLRAPECGADLKCPSFLTYHGSLASSIHMVVIGLNNSSAWVNKVFTLLSAVERLNRRFCTRIHKQTGNERGNEEQAVN